MARRSNQKLKLLYLSKILTEQTNDTVGLTLNEIKSLLEKYGIQCERKCLYDDIEALRIFGIDVKTHRDRYVRYYVSSSSIDLAELKLMTDFLSLCEYLPESKTRELLKKLWKPSNSIYEVLSAEEPERKNASLTEQIYKNIDIICRAIIGDRKINFKQFSWNANKQRILCRGGEYFCMSPQRLIFKNRKYVLVAYDEKADEIKELFPERMINISVSNQKRQLFEALPKDEPLENFRFKSDNSMAGDVFEYFGLGVTILSNREECFEFSAKSAFNDELLAWLFLKGGKVKIISPTWAADRFNRLLEENKK